jgi:salicylate hydroxylase
MLERYAGAANPLIQHVIEDAEDLYLWPVFTLSKSGKWATDKVMLIGDSAHAMPPQGESTGIVFEDGVLFARCLAKWMETRRQEGVPVKEAFDAYEKLRRARIDTAFDESQSVVKTVQDTPW